jgi:hypothetical protein
MDWSNLIKMIPLIAGSVNPAAGSAAAILIKIAEEEIQRRQQANPSMTRDEIIAEAGAAWQEGIDKATALRQKGHEDDV